MLGIGKILSHSSKIIDTIAKYAGKKGTKVLQIKHDISMPVNPSTITRANPATTITKQGLLTGTASGELGNVSIRLAEKLKDKEEAAINLFERLFPEYSRSIRTKGANSIFSKLEKQILKKDIEIACDAQAKSMIGDAVGARIIMPDLKPEDIEKVLSTYKLNLHIPGQGLVELSPKEQKILYKILNGQKVSSNERKLVEPYIKPVKNKLAEKQSEPVVKRLLSSSYQLALDEHRITLAKMESLVNKGELSRDIYETVKKNNEIKELLETFTQEELDSLIKSGEIPQELAQKLKLGEYFEGINITELSNYRGSDGIAYFSDVQIQQIKKMQIHTNCHFDISSASENLTCVLTENVIKKLDKLKNIQRQIRILSEKPGKEKEIAKLQEKLSSLTKKYQAEGINTSTLDSSAIKQSGYTTAQMNFTMADGTRGEIQIRGKGTFAEIEHMAYDARQGKNTLSATYDKYVKTVKGLSEKQYEKYSRYIKECYNYSRYKELGIQVPTPKLPIGLPKILSQKSMEELHRINAEIEKTIKQTFEPHIKVAA